MSLCSHKNPTKVGSSRGCHGTCLIVCSGLKSNNKKNENNLMNTRSTDMVWTFMFN